MDFDRYGFSALYSIELAKVKRHRKRQHRSDTTNAASHLPSVECVALNRVFRMGRGRQKKSVAMVRQPMIALTCSPTSAFTPRKFTNPVNRQFDCWEIPAASTGSRYRVFYTHGGGFIGGDWAGFRGFCERIHKLFDGAQLFFPNYRLAPEVTVLDQIEDCVAAYLYYTKNIMVPATAETSTPQIIVVGDSCGGALGLRLLQELVRRSKTDSSIILPNCGTFFSPVTDLACTGDSMVEMGKTYTDGATSEGEPIGECTFDPDVIKWSFDCALAAQNIQISGLDPRVSPLYASCEGLPPLYLLATAAEVFADDTRRFCAKLREANIEHVEDVWPCVAGGVFHAWPVFHKYARDDNIDSDLRALFHA